MSPPRRRGACPTLAEPMATGDGLLARFSPAAGGLAPAALAGLGEAALAHGNGVIEITARGAIQLRGLRPDTVGPLRDALAALGIAAAPPPAILAEPLAGLDATVAADSRVLAAGIAARAADLVLAPKLSVVVDGGGLLHLDGLSADLRLVAAGSPAGVLWHLAIDGPGGTARLLGALPAEHAVEAAWRVLSRLGPTTRTRELTREAATAMVADLLTPAPPRASRPMAVPVGLHALAIGAALGLGATFGQIDAQSLMRLAREAALLGASGFRTAPGRVLLATGLDAAAASRLRATAATAGFVTRTDDPRRRVSACPGAPACGSGQAATRDLALAAAASGLLDASVTLHVSGCAKGCAHPGAATITLVGAGGDLDLVLRGTARGAPLGRLPAGAASAALTRLGDAVAPLRREGATTAEALRRLGWQPAGDLLLGRGA